jgi:hypothetical protein
MTVIQNWKTKMIASIICAFVSGFSNYYSVKCIMGEKRLFVSGFEITDYHTLLLSIMFNLLIIYFYLLRSRFLIFLSVACSVGIAVYSWTIMLRGKSVFGFEYFDFFVCSFLAVIPIVILNILMREVAEEADVI